MAILSLASVTMEHATDHNRLSNYLLIIIMIIFPAVRLLKKKKIKEKTMNETKKPNVDAFDEMISLAESGHISKETKRKMLLLWLQDQGEIAQKEEDNANKPDTTLTEAESLLKTAVPGFHSWEALQVISGTVSD